MIARADRISVVKGFEKKGVLTVINDGHINLTEQFTTFFGQESSVSIAHYAGESARLQSTES